MVTAKAKLRAQVFDFAHGDCEWPQCNERATELAHLTSSGMGGSKHRDTHDNSFAACPAHARISDGLPPPGGGIKERNAEYGKVPGAEPRQYPTMDGWELGWHTRDVMEALRLYLQTMRGK